MLTRHGVEVEVVRSVTAVDAGAGTTLVVAQPALVPFEELPRLAAAQDLVLVEPDAVVLDELGVAVTPAGTARGPAVGGRLRPPRRPVARRALAGGQLYRLTEAAAEPRGGPRRRTWLCYLDEDRRRERPGLAGRASRPTHGRPAGRRGRRGRPA